MFKPIYIRRLVAIGNKRHLLNANGKLITSPSWERSKFVSIGLFSVEKLSIEFGWTKFITESISQRNIYSLELTALGKRVTESCNEAL